ncbi:5' nucleotidase, NT5C type [Mucilaginibacter ginkgonis]|uniref:5'(3')-deoxyribonucleotidase n=1 Tax=Mucilaginibacter ginkgonis TaxID=2682091 RepID=A0A6I4IP07_9SPHI|nr:5'(3')-deoxyribonucleotidase [Mucilaginibacter ginkgonis]QQL48334.1 5'(3')-deoxyribonucleotidase [Mucilaginibacter ginkgonis]
MEKRKIIAIDMDGVLADTDQHFLTWYERDYGVRMPYESLLGKPEYEAFPVEGAIRKMVFTPGFFRTLPVMDGAVEAVKSLMQDYNVFIVSAAMEFPNSLNEKYDWLAQHFPFISWKNIVFCGDKSIIDADYLIDDHCKNLDNFKGKPLMFHSAHNVNQNHHQRVKTWAEVLTAIKEHHHGIIEKID